MFHWKKMIAVLCACVLVTACAGAFAEDYTASAPGMGGDVPVTVSYEDGRITAVTVGENNETPGIGDQAINAIPGRIVEEQSLTVDTVAGATVTSNAILTAAEAALTAGGVDVTPFKQEKQPTELVEGEAVETDIVIVGAGISGLMAAYELKEDYPDVSFIAVDVSAADLGTDAKENLYCAVFGEEQAGYLAGYAAVKDGYTKLGFLGGMAVPAVQRYGYGFVQGVSAAAAELNVPVEVNYTYGGQFFGDANITAKMDGWYAAGTEIVFACGGGIYTSAAEAAAKVKDAKVIGVDTDQSAIIDKDYGKGMTLTSAMKGLAESVNEALTDALNNGWKFSETYSGKETKLGAAENCVGLPMSTSKFTKFTQEQYDSMYASIVDGTLAIDDSYDADVKPAVTTIAVDYQN